MRRPAATGEPPLRHARRRFKPSWSTETCLPLQVALLSIDKLRRPHCQQRSPRLWGRPRTRAGAACRAARGAV